MNSPTFHTVNIYIVMEEGTPKNGIGVRPVQAFQQEEAAEQFIKMNVEGKIYDNLYIQETDLNFYGEAA